MEGVCFWLWRQTLLSVSDHVTVPLSHPGAQPESLEHCSTSHVSKSPNLSPDSSLGLKVSWFEVRMLNFWKSCNEDSCQWRLLQLSDSLPS